MYSETDRILVAVSGGIDSMVLLWLFYKAGLSCGVAHCNFGLRGEESDGDEALVRDAAAKYGFDFFTERFDTENFAEKEGLSTQMAARELRYRWFRTIQENNGFDKIAIAHHRDDSIETFFINLLRGTGIQGLTGIHPIQDIYIRPLLFASRPEIADFASQNGIEFREDRTNLTDDYSRNYIRHNILPVFHNAYPNFGKVMSDNIDRLRDAALLYQESVYSKTDYVISLKDGMVNIDIERLRSMPAPETVLFEILRNYGFSRHIPAQILSLWSGLSGKQFFSQSHRLVCDRDTLILERLSDPSLQVYYLEEDENSIEIPVSWNMKVIDKPDDYIPGTDAGTVSFDRDSLVFPLILRHWRKGDYFMPLGLGAIKKVSDFFVDNKLSIPQKENVWILASGNDIVWIVGMRIDHRFRVKDSTKRVLEIQFKL